MKKTPAEYRAAAVRLYGSAQVSVSSWAAVQMVVGGAFVEVMVWVPDAAVAEQPARDKDVP